MDTNLDIDPLELLAAKIREREATVSVVGLGYAGLPLLLGIAGAGYPVIGIDADPNKVSILRGGRSYIVDVSDSEIAALDQASFSTVPASLQEADIIVLCLPTPLTDGFPTSRWS